MRIFWAGFLMTGLVLSAYEGWQATDEAVTSEATVHASEDGTPMPHPYPTPKTR